MEQVLVEPTYTPTDVRPTAGGLDGLLLLLLATGGPCDLRGLLDAAGAMAAQRLDESALDLLVRTGLAVSRRGRLTLPSDQTARELLEQTPPSAVAAAHAAWAEVLVDDWGERARHEALAVIGPNDCAAQRAASTALRLQRAGRQESATEMFELAARISAPGAVRVELLMRGAACAYAAASLNAATSSPPPRAGCRWLSRRRRAACWRPRFGVLKRRPAPRGSITSRPRPCCAPGSVRRRIRGPGDVSGPALGHGAGSPRRVRRRGGRASRLRTRSPRWPISAPATCRRPCRCSGRRLTTWTRSVSTAPRLRPTRSSERWRPVSATSGPRPGRSGGRASWPR